MLENIRGHSRGSIPPLRMPSPLPHDLCHEWNVSRRLPAEKTLESPLDCKEIDLLKETNPGCSLEGLMLKLKLQYFGHFMGRVDSLEKNVMLGKTEASLQSKGLSRVFSNTTVQKHQFFGAQPSSQSNSHIHK